MYKISYEPHGYNDLMPGSIKNTNVKNNIFNKGLVSVSLSCNERNIKKFFSDINKSVKIRPDNDFSKHKSILALSDRQFKNMGQSLRQQSEDISVQFQNRLVPTFSSPLTLKGKIGFCLGVGLLSNITSCAYFSHHRIKTSNDIAMLVNLSDSTIGEHSERYNMERFSPKKCHSASIDTYHKYVVENNSEDVISDGEQNNSQYLGNFLQKTGVLSNDLSSGNLKKEVLVSAVAKYLYDDSITTPEQKISRYNDIAISILKDNALYESGQEDTINERLTELIISYWLFSTVLNMSPEKYITDRMNSSSYPAYFTVSSIRVLLGLNDLFKINILNFQDIPAENWGEFNAMWYHYLEYKIPILKYPRTEVDGIPLNSHEFSKRNSGSVILSEHGHSTGYTLSEVMQRG